MLWAFTHVGKPVHIISILCLNRKGPVPGYTHSNPAAAGSHNVKHCASEDSKLELQIAFPGHGDRTLVGYVVPPWPCRDDGNGIVDAGQRSILRQSKPPADALA